MSLILPWAKDKHPDKYRATLQVVNAPKVFEKYLIRLIEIRLEAEPEWLREVPLWALDETKTVLKVRHKPTGKVLEIRGRRAAPRQYGFSDLRRTPQDFAARIVATEALDLEMI